MEQLNMKIKGNVYFYPQNYPKNNWAIFNCDINIVKYYSYWIKKYFNVKLQKPKHGAHVTVIRDERISSYILSSKWTSNQNIEIEIEYTNEIKTNGEHFWLPIKSDKLLNIREYMGLSRITEYPLHLTIGRLNEHDKKLFNINDFYKYLNK